MSLTMKTCAVAQPMAVASAKANARARTPLAIVARKGDGMASKAAAGLAAASQLLVAGVARAGELAEDKTGYSLPDSLKGPAPPDVDLNTWAVWAAQTKIGDVPPDLLIKDAVTGILFLGLVAVAFGGATPYNEDK